MKKENKNKKSGMSFMINSNSVIAITRVSISMLFFLITIVLFYVGMTPLFAQNENTNKTAIVGEVSKLASGSISLTSQTKVVEFTVDSSTQISGAKGKIAFNQIKIGDVVGAIAASASSSRQASESAKQLAQKLFVRQASPSALLASAIVGVVTGVNGSEITLLNKDDGDMFYTIPASGAAVIKGKANQIIDLAQITLGERIVVVGTLDNENTITPTIIHIVSAK